MCVACPWLDGAEEPSCSWKLFEPTWSDTSVSISQHAPSLGHFALSLYLKSATALVHFHTLLILTPSVFFSKCQFMVSNIGTHLPSLFGHITMAVWWLCVFSFENVIFNNTTLPKLNYLTFHSVKAYYVICKRERESGTVEYYVTLYTALVQPAASECTHWCCRACSNKNSTHRYLYI